MDESVDIHAPEFARDPFAEYERLREKCPVFSNDRYGGFTLLTRYEDVRAAAIDWRTYTSAVVGVTAIPVITHRDRPQLPIELDPPLHSAYRDIVNPLFAAARLAELKPRVDALSHRLMEAMIGSRDPEFVAGYADPFSVGALGVLTGLPTGDAAKWHEWLRRMFTPKDPAAAKEASRGFGEYIDGLIRHRREAPADDIVSVLLAARVLERPLTDEEIHSYLTVFFGAGFETTADAMSGAAFWLAEEPGRLAVVRDLGERVGTAVEEFLRFVTPIQMFGRNTTRDVELHGSVIPNGRIVALGFGAANRDPRVFPDAEICVPGRVPNRHLTFGAGPHLCLGAPLARMEMEIMLRHLCALTGEIAVRADDQPVWKRRGDRRGLQRLPLSFGAVPQAAA